MHVSDAFAAGSRAPRVALAVGALFAVIALAGCSGPGPAGAPVSVQTTASRYHGTVLEPPERLTGKDLTSKFRSSQGGTTTLAALQRDHLMIVYFGYTHCPDVCPTTMADLGTALRTLPRTDQERVRVVFITSDPDRDTPAVMKAWLANFDSDLAPFIGLTASNHQIDAVARSVGVPISPPVKHKNGTISVQHGAQSLPFVKGAAHLVWTGGTESRQYAADIRRLLDQLPTR